MDTCRGIQGRRWDDVCVQHCTSPLGDTGVNSILLSSRDGSVCRNVLTWSHALSSRSQETLASSPLRTCLEALAEVLRFLSSACL